MLPRVRLARIQYPDVDIWNLESGVAEVLKYSVYQVFGRQVALIFHIWFGVARGSSLEELRFAYMAELEISNSHVSYHP